MTDDIPLFQTVLLLEDDDSHAMLIKRALAGLCGVITHVRTCAEAVTALKMERPDLAITDLNVPDGAGTEVLSRILEVSADIPVIVLTSSTSLRDGIDAMKLGARDFIVKNFDKTFADVLNLAFSRVFSSVTLENERRALRRDVETLRTAIASSNDGFAVLGTQGQTLFSNVAYDGIILNCGGDRKSLLSIDPEKISQGSEILTTLRERLADLRDGRAWQTEITLKTQDDGAFELYLAAVKDETPPNAKKSAEDTPAGVVWIRDIRDRKRRERLQKELLSTTTHDLKGPLGAIALSCDVLLDHSVPENRSKELIQRIASSASNAINLIEELLSARRIEEGSLVLKPSKQDVCPLVIKVVETMEVNATTRGIALTAVLPETLCWGNVDTLGFERVLTNLVSNAIKFTPKGGRITVELRDLAEGIEVRVSDTGQGMEPHEVQRLFQRFSRLSKHSGTPGTGLGLFIVKSIVGAHGGRVEVISAPGKGATFSAFYPSEPPVDARGESLCLGGANA